MFLRNKNEHFLRLLLVLCKMIGLLKASVMQDIEMKEVSGEVKDVCSICNFRAVEKLSPHKIPESFPMLRIEYTIYPLKENRKEIIMFPFVIKIGNIPLKHIKCSVTLIRFGEIRKTCDITKLNFKDVFFEGKDRDKVIENEWKWIAQVLLTLRNEKPGKNFRQGKGHLDLILEYLSATLPDLLINLRVNLDSIISNWKLNREEKSIKNLLDKLENAEANTFKYHLSVAVKPGLEQIFQMADGYFLYLMTRVDDFIVLYSAPTIMKFLCGDKFARNNAVLEPFDIFKTLFIAMVALKIKNEENPGFHKFLNFVKDLKMKFRLNKKLCFDFSKMLKKAEKFYLAFDEENPDNFVKDTALNLKLLKSTINTIINILRQDPKNVTDDDKKCITKINFSPSYFTKWHDLGYYSGMIISAKIICYNYKLFIVKFVCFGLSLKSLSKRKCDGFNNSSILTTKHLFRNVIKDFKFCMKCRIITFVIFYFLNYVVCCIPSIAKYNYGELRKLKLSNDFRIQMALKTAIYVYYLRY